MASIPVPASARPSAGLAASTFGIARRGVGNLKRTPPSVVVGTLHSAHFLQIIP